MKFSGIIQKIAFQKQKKAIIKLREYCDESGNIIKKCENLEFFSQILTESKIPIYEARRIYHQMLKKITDINVPKESMQDPLSHIDLHLREIETILNLYDKEENKERKQDLLAIYFDAIISMKDIINSEKEHKTIYQKSNKK